MVPSRLVSLNHKVTEVVGLVFHVDKTRTECSASALSYKETAFRPRTMSAVAGQWAWGMWAFFLDLPNVLSQK